MTHPDIDQSALKPCPFCGASPQSEPWHGGAPTKIMISCSNAEYGDEHGGCSVGPMVSGETPDEAIAAWNRRAALEPVAWLIEDPSGELSPQVTLRPQEPDSETGLVISPLCRAALEAQAAPVQADEPHRCPVCLEPFKPDDTCATDIELGICHAACLEGSPTVDLDTGEPVDGPIPTYPYEPYSGAACGSMFPSDPDDGVTTSHDGREAGESPSLAAPLPAPKDEDLSRQLAEARAELARMKERRLFPILGSKGQKIDWQLVADHGEQARNNHYQSVARLAERGGLGWTELYAVLHNKPFQSMDTNEAIIACRALEARYLAALSGSALTITAKDEKQQTTERDCYEMAGDDFPSAPAASTGGE